MKRIVLFCLLLTVGTTLAQAPAGSNHAAVEKQIVASERAINDAVAKGDMKTFHANLVPEAVGIDGGGINKVNSPDFDKMMQQAKIQSWNLDGSQFYWVNDNTVIHMYRWTGKGTFDGQPITSPTWASTVWANKGGKWLAVFHQESAAMTPATAATPAAKPAPGKK